MNARRAAKGCALLVSSLLLCACASIPLGTLWQLRDFGPADLATIDPEEVRVAVRIDPPPLRTDPQRTRLSLLLTPRNGAPPERYSFGLRGSQIFRAVLAPQHDPHWQVMELNDTARSRMRALQPRLLAARQLYKTASLKVDSKFVGEPPPELQYMMFSIRVQLDETRPPIVLFDRARLKIERETETSQ